MRTHGAPNPMAEPADDIEDIDHADIVQGGSDHENHSSEERDWSPMDIQ